MSVERPSPDLFAVAMAERLNRVVPSGLSVRANGSSIDVYGRKAECRASSAADLILEEDGRSLVELIETAASAILNGAQDAVMEILAEEWPLGANGAVVYPEARVDGGQLVMWFGDEPAPVVLLQPLEVSDVIAVQPNMRLKLGGVIVLRESGSLCPGGHGRSSTSLSPAAKLRSVRGPLGRPRRQEPGCLKDVSWTGIVLPH